MSTLIPLASVRVANPCSADWDKMQGDDRVRFCQSCAKNVFNLSELSKAEAEKLITEKQGNLCVQYYQRKDGTIITDDCPIGLKIIRRPFKWIAASFVALFAAVNVAQARTRVMGEPAPTPDKNKSTKRVVVGKTRIYRAAPKLKSVPKTDQGKGIIRGRIASPKPKPTPKPKPKE